MVSVKPIFQSRHLVGGTIEGNISFFDAHNHIPLHTWKSSSILNGVIRVIAVNPAETLVAVGFSTGAISLIESRTGTLVASWKGGDTEITSVSSDLFVSEYLVDIDIVCRLDQVLYGRFAAFVCTRRTLDMLLECQQISAGQDHCCFSRCHLVGYLQGRDTDHQ